MIRLLACSALALVCLLAAACEGFRKQPGLLEAVGVLPRPPIELSVMSFNIRYGTANDGQDAWPSRRGLVFETILNARADVIAVQEALAFQLTEIREALPEFAMVGVGRDDGRQAGEFSAILYRRARFTVTESGTFWFSDTPAQPGSTSWGNSIPRICTWARLVERLDWAGGSGRAVYVFNVHLDHQSEPSRVKSAELLRDRVIQRANRNEPAIVMGDFNAGEDSPAYAILAGQRATLPMLDAFRAVHPDETHVGTFHGFRGLKSSHGPKIDHIFIAPGDNAVEVITADIERFEDAGRLPSDHYPVTATIRISEKAAPPPKSSVPTTAQPTDAPDR